MFAQPTCVKDKMAPHWLADWGMFAAVMALGQFSPGPDMILLTRTSLKSGRSAGWQVTLGIVTGLCLHAALAIGGVTALLRQGGSWEKVLGVVAAGYLFWLGWQMFRSFVRLNSGVLGEAEKGSEKGSWFVQGLLCNLLNPKVVIFFAGITTVFLKGEHDAWWPILLWATIVLEGLFLWGLWVAILQKGNVRAVYEKLGKWLDLGFGGGLWLLAILMLWQVF